MFKGRALAFITAPSMIALSGCGFVTKPPLEYKEGATKVAVAQVVKRVKCDIWRSVLDLTRQYPELTWLKQWSAKVHMTIVVDDLAQLNPGLALTNPMRNAYGITQGPNNLPLTASAFVTPTIASIQQFFTLGIGGELAAEATRQEDLEFFISFAELDNKDNKSKVYKTESLNNPDVFGAFDGCEFTDADQLDSELGLQEWIEDAVFPSTGEPSLLERGPHGGFKAGDENKIPLAAQAELDKAEYVKSKTIKAAKAKNESEQNAKVNTRFNLSTKLSTQEMDAFVRQAPTEDEKAKDEALRILKKGYEIKREEAAQKVQFYLDIAKRYYSSAGDAANKAYQFKLKCANKVQEVASKAESFISFINADLEKIMKASYPDTEVLEASEAEAKSFKDQVSHYSHAAVDTYNKCPDIAKTKVQDQYDALDLISHQLSFVITLNGNVTPIWKLARVATPGSPNFASLQTKKTNTLIIALGRPTEEGKPSAAQDSLINSALIGNQIKSAIAP